MVLAFVGDSTMTTFSAIALFYIVLPSVFFCNCGAKACRSYGRFDKRFVTMGSKRSPCVHWPDRTFKIKIRVKLKVLMRGFSCVDSYMPVLGGQAFWA